MHLLSFILRVQIVSDWRDFSRGIEKENKKGLIALERRVEEGWHSNLKAETKGMPLIRIAEIEHAEISDFIYKVEEGGLHRDVEDRLKICEFSGANEQGEDPATEERHGYDLLSQVESVGYKRRKWINKDQIEKLSEIFTNFPGCQKIVRENLTMSRTTFWRIRKHIRKERREQLQAKVCKSSRGRLASIEEAYLKKLIRPPSIP
jgi:hypothetical protein